MSRNRTLELRPATAELAMGASIQLNLVVVTGPTRTELIPGHRASWVSSAPAVADVNRQGRLTARGPGVATVTATHDGLTALATVTVAATT